MSHKYWLRMQCYIQASLTDFSPKQKLMNSLTIRAKFGNDPSNIQKIDFNHDCSQWFMIAKVLL